jgi:hypothetical protein
MPRTTQNLALLAALMDETTTQDDVRTLKHLTNAALTLAGDPELALAWGRVLTEHTAPAVAATARRHNEAHPYLESNVWPGRCTQWLEDGVTKCGRYSDAPVHRVEELTADQHHALLDMTWVGDAQVVAALGEFGFVVRGQVTTRGQAWLEAHPRTDGGAS